jgi:hypothetical protein
MAADSVDIAAMRNRHKSYRSELTVVELLERYNERED